MKKKEWAESTLDEFTREHTVQDMVLLSTQVPRGKVYRRRYKCEGGVDIAMILAHPGTWFQIGDLIMCDTGENMLQKRYGSPSMVRDRSLPIMIPYHAGVGDVLTASHKSAPLSILVDFP